MRRRKASLTHQAGLPSDTPGHRPEGDRRQRNAIKGHFLDMPDEPIISIDDAKAIIEQYQKVAQAAIIEAEGWLRQGALSRAIPETIPDAILVTDVAGLIVSVNTKFELMFGYHRSEVIGQIPEMLIPEAARARHVALRREYSENPRMRDMSVEMPLRGRRKNGTEMNLLIKLGPVVIPAGIYTIVVIRKVRD
jgi:PAS domain S-box-containing protein